MIDQHHVQRATEPRGNHNNGAVGKHSLLTCGMARNRYLAQPLSLQATTARELILYTWDPVGRELLSSHGLLVSRFIRLQVLGGKVSLQGLSLPSLHRPHDLRQQ